MNTLALMFLSLYVLAGPDRGTDQISGNDLVETVAVLDAAGQSSSVLASRGGRLAGDYADFRTAGEITVEAYVNLDSSTGDRWVAGCEKSGANGKTWWKFGILGDGSLAYAYDTDTNHQDIAVQAGILPKSGWVQVKWHRHSDGVTVDFSVSNTVVQTVTANAVAQGGSESTVIVMNDAYNLGAHRLSQVSIQVP